MTRPGTLIGMVLMLMTAFFGGSEPGVTAGQGAPINRAGLARASASSVRLARLNEIPTTRNPSANVKLAAPAIRPRWVARYAVDGSVLTRWASAEDAKEMPWLELELGTATRPRVMVAGMTINWGPAYASRYQVMASIDGNYHKPAYQQNQCPGGAETITFDPPVPARSLRIEALAKTGSSIEIVDLRIFGSADEAAPTPISALRADAGPRGVKLSWDQDDEVTAFYRIFRAEGAAPKPTPEFMIAIVGEKKLDDPGLKPGREYHYLVVPETYGGRTAAGKTAQVRTAAADEFERFPLRGIVEGFYNDPWPHQERLAAIRFLAGHGYNYYIYAPKLDPYHRQLWRTPYPQSEMKNFAELIMLARANHITLSYGISPGLDMNMASADERQLLLKKLKAMFDGGFRSFTLCLDDIPGDDNATRALGDAHARLVNEVYEYLKALDPAAHLLFVPTIYSRTPSWLRANKKGSSDYLAALANIDPAVGIMWTGPTDVFSVNISRADAFELAKLWDRKILIWDNYPVNDVTLRYNVFTGPYVGRAPDLDSVVRGIMLNPMFLPGASRIPLYTAGVYMTRRNYDPWAAYDEALAALAPDEAGHQALKAVSDCLTPHPVFPELSVERMPIYLAIADFWRTRGKGKDLPEEQRLRALLSAYAAAPAGLRANVIPSIADDLLPPAQKLALYGQAGLKCLELMSTGDPEKMATLRAEALRLQAQARLNPWLVADERTTLSSRYLGGRILNRNVLDDFITRAVATVRP